MAKDGRDGDTGGAAKLGCDWNKWKAAKDGCDEDARLLEQSAGVAVDVVDDVAFIVE